MQTMQSAQATPNTPVYSTVKQFSDKHHAFSVGSLRALIFNATSNGLNEIGAIVRIGRKVLLNETKFLGWIEAQRGAKVFDLKKD
jgi:hypothetical protein